MAAAQAKRTEPYPRPLMAAVGSVRDALERAAKGESRPPGADDTDDDSLASWSALRTLVSAFGLSPFERDILLLCAGIELDGRFASLCASAQADAARPYPTFSLALATLSRPHWSAIAPVAPLRRWRLVECDHPASGSPLTARVRIDAR